MSKRSKKELNFHHLETWSKNNINKRMKFIRYSTLKVVSLFKISWINWHAIFHGYIRWDCLRLRGRRMETFFKLLRSSFVVLEVKNHCHLSSSYIVAWNFNLSRLQYALFFSLLDDDVSFIYFSSTFISVDDSVSSRYIADTRAKIHRCRHRLRETAISDNEIANK